MQSLQHLGEDENETENFLHGLNSANKNAVIKVNLQYVLSLLNKLGENDPSSPVPAATDNSYRAESKNSENTSQKFPPKNTRRDSVAVNSIGNLETKDDMTLTQFLKSEFKNSNDDDRTSRGESKQQNYVNDSHDDKRSSNNRK